MFSEESYAGPSEEVGLKQIYEVSTANGSSTQLCLKQVRDDGGCNVIVPRGSHDHLKHYQLSGA